MQLDGATRKKLLKGLTTYMAYFGTRYVLNDLDRHIGVILDSQWVRLFTLFCIMYNATERVDIAFILVCFFVTLKLVLMQFVDERKDPTTTAPPTTAAIKI